MGSISLFSSFEEIEELTFIILELEVASIIMWGRAPCLVSFTEDGSLLTEDKKTKLLVKNTDVHFGHQL